VTKIFALLYFFKVIEFVAVSLEHQTLFYRLIVKVVHDLSQQHFEVKVVELKHESALVVFTQV
jgi:hypothetical protein